MNRLVLVSLVAAMGANAHAANLVNSGTYVCMPEKKDHPNKVLVNGPYTVKLAQPGPNSLSRVMSITDSDGKEILAKLQPGNQGAKYSVVRSSLSSKTIEYVLIDGMSGEEKYAKPSLRVHFEGERWLESLDCKLTSRPVLAPEPQTRFSCKVDAPYEGQQHGFDFAVTNLADPEILDLVYLPGDESLVFSGMPKESIFFELNDNTSFDYDYKRKALQVTGDADGVFLVDLVLFTGSRYSKGYVRIRGSSPDYRFYSTVSCSVR